jgi:hypothetical protein
MGLTLLKRSAVGGQLQQLRGDIEAWKHWPENGPFATHALQLARVIDYVERFLSELDARFVGANDLQALNDLERRVIGTSKIWNYFREKFLQREDGRLGDALELADDLAWACYSPLWRAAGAVSGDASVLKSAYQRRAQPLVYFHHQRSPMATARDGAFTPTELESSERKDRELLKLLARIPVPVVGVPWFQAEHLPESVLLAHEIGHLVVEDFDLLGNLKQIVESVVDAERRSLWTAWIEECFCDVFAVACTGAAFALALMPYLVGSRAALEKEEKAETDPGVYPPRLLRMHLVLRAVEDLELGVALGAFNDPIAAPKIVASSARALWETEFGAEDKMGSSYRDDANALARALLDRKFAVFGPEGSLRELVALAPAHAVRASELAFRYLTSRKPQDNALDLRVVLAAATLAHAQGPTAWADRNRAAPFMKTMKDVLAGSTRGAVELDPLMQPRGLDESRRAFDQRAAELLFHEFDVLFDQ